MYTSHGHHIPGTTLGPDRPESVARCGGPKVCSQCAREAQSLGTPVPDIMRYFSSEHLSAPLQRVSQQFAFVATQMQEMLPDGPEKSVTLRKLLEAKDAAVRAALDL